MNTKQTTRSLIAVALFLFLALSCKEPKGREWDNAYPDQPGQLDVDGPPRVRADEEYIDRRTAPDPLDEQKAREKEAEKKGTGEPEDPKKDGI